MVITGQHRQFEQEGYAVFPACIPPDTLEILRHSCAGFVAREDARMESLGVSNIGITHRGQRYFVNECQRVDPSLRGFLFSDLMAEICRATLGPDAYFFFDQFVVKGPEGGLSFSWHQDSGYVVGNGGPADHLPYLTCWCTLDDATEENGTVRVIPFSQCPQSRDNILPHQRDPLTHDLIGWTGDGGTIVEVPAGSIVAFSSRLLHATGANRSARPRRVYLAQYTAEAMLDPGSRHLRRNAIAFLRDGSRVTTA